MSEPPPQSPPGATPAIVLEGVSYAYPGAPAPALEKVSLRVEPGERLGVLGPNGGGKSTLIKLALGVITPSAGRVSVFGEDPGRARRGGVIGYVPQRVTAELAFPLTALQVVRMPAEIAAGAFGRVPREVDDHIARVTELAGVTPFGQARIGELSGGQLQRVMIARALAARPSLLLLDEPMVGIDVSGQRRFADMVSLLADELALTIVTVSHDLRTVALSSDRVACLRRTLHYHDAPGGLSPRVLAELFQHDIEAVFGEGDAHLHAVPGPPASPKDGGEGCGCAHH